MKKDVERKFLTIDDIQREYLPVSHKKLRAWVKETYPSSTLADAFMWKGRH